MICGYCERSLIDGDLKLMKTVDHFIPISKGGSKGSSYNKVISCRQCNQVKGDMMPEEFLNKVERIRASAFLTDHQRLYPIIKKNLLGYMEIKQPYKFRIKRIKKIT